MQKRKKRFVILWFFLLLVSLACFSAIGQVGTDSVEVGVSPSPLASLPEGEGNATCAVISAEEALHLRVGSDANAPILGFMESGEVVTLISARNADWWLIKRGDLVGYARSKYLEKSECGS